MTAGRDIVALVDFDGTLFDTREATADAMDATFAEAGIEMRWRDETRERLGCKPGTPYRGVIEAACAEHGASVSRHDVTTMTSAFLGRLVSSMRETAASMVNRPVADLCLALHGAGATLRVQSGNDRTVIRAALGAAGLRDAFESIHTSAIAGELAWAGPLSHKAAVMMSAMRERGYREPPAGRRVLVIGDEAGDAIGAWLMGADFVLARPAGAAGELSLDGAVIRPKWYVSTDGAKLPDYVEKMIVAGNYFGR